MSESYWYNEYKKANEIANGFIKENNALKEENRNLRKSLEAALKNDKEQEERITLLEALNEALKVQNESLLDNVGDIKVENKSLRKEVQIVNEAMRGMEDVEDYPKEDLGLIKPLIKMCEKGEVSINED